MELNNRIVSQRFLFYYAGNVERQGEFSAVYSVPYLSLFLTWNTSVRLSVFDTCTSFLSPTLLLFVWKWWKKRWIHWKWYGYRCKLSYLLHNFLSSVHVVSNMHSDATDRESQAHCKVSTTSLQGVTSGISFGLQLRFWAVKIVEWWGLSALHVYCSGSFLSDVWY